MSSSEVYTTVRINRGLVLRVKTWALRHGITMSDAVTQLVAAGLAGSVNGTASDTFAAPRPARPDTTYRVKNEERVDTSAAWASPMADLATAVSLLTDVVRALPQQPVENKGSSSRLKAAS